MPPYAQYIRRTVTILILGAFFVSAVKAPAYAQTQAEQGVRLPAPGVMVHLSQDFTPAHLQGITIHPDNALQFDFLIHRGDQVLQGLGRQEEYKKLVKYFLASLTIPDEDQWVNLSPYEHSRIIKDDFGKTQMGRDLLAQDYMLKQITSSLMYPQEGLGKKFWDKVYARAWREYHTTNIPVNTFNKVWIVPDQATVYESGNSAYILKSHLKVMLEEDYLSSMKHQRQPGDMFPRQGGGTCPQAGCQASNPMNVRATQRNSVNALGTQVIREIILPELENEVNEGKNFASLRQMYSGMVLATWFKKSLKESLLGKIYADKGKVKGVDQDPKINEDIYQRYLKAFKKGVFNYIKDDVDRYTHEVIPRKYFSGGFVRKSPAMRGQDDVHIIHSGDVLSAQNAAMIPEAIDLPLDVMRVGLIPENNHPVLAHGAMKAATILVAEDDKRTRQLLERFLRRNGYQVKTADSPDALKAMMENEGNDVSVVIIDTQTKGSFSSWVDVVKGIPALTSGAVKTIAMSNNPDNERVWDESGVPIRDFIDKTTIHERLVPAIQSILQSTDGAMQSKRATILVVDDEKPIIENLTELLGEEGEGFRVLTAASPQELNKVVQAHEGEIDLLITDTTGWIEPVAEVLAKVKNDLGREIPVIATSGKDSEDDWMRDGSLVIPAKDFRFLRKPYRLAAILDTVESMLPKNEAMKVYIEGLENQIPEENMSGSRFEGRKKLFVNNPFLTIVGDPYEIIDARTHKITGDNEVQGKVKLMLTDFYKSVYGAEFKETFEYEGKTYQAVDAQGVYVQLKENGPWFLIVQTPAPNQGTTEPRTSIIDLDRMKIIEGNLPYLRGSLILDVHSESVKVSVVDPPSTSPYKVMIFSLQKDASINNAMIALSRELGQRIIVKMKARNPRYVFDPTQTMQEFVDQIRDAGFDVDEELNVFIEHMRSNNPLFNNRNSTFFYNLLLRLVKLKRAEIWQGWLFQAGVWGQLVGAAVNKGVRPDQIQVPSKIDLKEGFSLTNETKEPNTDLLNMLFRDPEGNEIGHLKLLWDLSTRAWIINEILIYGDKPSGLGREAVLKLVEYLGTIRSSDIVDPKTSIEAQFMWEQSDAYVDYVGTREGINETGYAYILNKPKIKLPDTIDYSDFREALGFDPYFDAGGRIVIDGAVRTHWDIPDARISFSGGQEKGKKVVMRIYDEDGKNFEDLTSIAGDWGNAIFRYKHFSIRLINDQHLGLKLIPQRRELLGRLGISPWYYHAGEAQGHAFIVVDWLEGKSLDKFSRSDADPADMINALLKDMLSHKILLDDFKMSNFMIGHRANDIPAANEDRAWLVDGDKANQVTLGIKFLAEHYAGVIRLNTSLIADTANPESWRRINYQKILEYLDRVAETGDPVASYRRNAAMNAITIEKVAKNKAILAGLLAMEFKLDKFDNPNRNAWPSKKEALEKIDTIEGVFDFALGLLRDIDATNTVERTQLDRVITDLYPFMSPPDLYPYVRRMLALGFQVRDSLLREAIIRTTGIVSGLKVNKFRREVRVTLSKEKEGDEEKLTVFFKALSKISGQRVVYKGTASPNGGQKYYSLVFQRDIITYDPPFNFTLSGEYNRNIDIHFPDKKSASLGHELSEHLKQFAFIGATPEAFDKMGSRDAFVLQELMDRRAIASAIRKLQQHKQLDLYYMTGEGLVRFLLSDSAMMFTRPRLSQRSIQDASFFRKGGIDFNAANMAMVIKRDGKGVALPLVQQDMAQLNLIQGFEPDILDIRSAINVPILRELQQKLQASSN